MGLFDTSFAERYAGVINEGIKQAKESSGGFQELEVGVYLAKSVSLKLAKTKEKNHDMIVWEFVILSEGKFQNKRHWENFVVEKWTTDALGNVVEDFEAEKKTWAKFFRTVNIFFEDTEFSIVDFSQLTDEVVEYYMLNKECAINVVAGKNEGTKFVNIASAKTLQADVETE